ncbi:MAG TPA: 3-phosphoserine/phosphohydroxythreonine transaminase [Candidatus Saccharimonadales bacterium]|nr:3-phosphoserine/phosphohydroxythreonine transaminase [Candidatus Saccharimonadales bacterium]
MKRVYNFSAGPAMLAEEVLQKAADEILDYENHGMSVMEMSHRGKEFLQIAEETEADLRELMKIPANYKVLFLQGGATGQFAAIPMNLSAPGEKADYIMTGLWGKKAVKEAGKYLDVNVAAQSEPFNTVPEQKSWKLSDNPAYVHITSNETINGVAFNYTPEVEAPLVADISSMILSEPLDVSKYGVLYAGAQKNIGPAGLTIVIVREELLGKAREDTPMIWNWSEKSVSGSMLNTPPTYSWYIAGLVCKWLKSKGGVEGIAKVNKRKAEKLYTAIDESDFYKNEVDMQYRSKMNVVFTLPDPELDKAFKEQAHARGLKNLGGHRSIGGMRASIYNAMPEEGVDELIKFMEEFENNNG